jgi:hypothetical protein
LAYAIVQTPGNGTNRLFSVPFPFIVRAHVKVYLGYDVATATGAELVDGLGFTWLSDTQIQTTAAPATYTTLTIIRKTPNGSQLVLFAPGSPPTQPELNTANLQSLYAIQEQADLYQSTIDAAITAAAVAISTANAVAAVLPYQPIASVSLIPASPTTGQRIEIGNTTGLNSFAPVAGRPAGFVGGTNLKARMIYGTPVAATWNWVDYYPLDPDGRYAGIDFTQLGTGATPRALTNKLQDSLISVKDFGADPTGTTSSTAAFSAAVASTSATIVGIYVPPGNYRLSTSPSIGSKTVTWFFAQGAFTTNGSGDIGAALPGSVVSNSVYWQPWAAGGNQVLGGPYGYMGSASLTTAYPGHGRLGFSSLGNPTANANGATIGFSSGMINQTPSGTAASSTWNFYGASVAASASSNATTQCIELDIAAMAGSTDKTYGLVIACGGEIADPATYSASRLFKSVNSALQISPNGDTRYENLNFLNGLLIQGAAISPTLNNAIYLGSGHAMRWANTGNAFVGQVSCSATTSAQAVWLDLGQYGATFSTLSGSGLFQVANSATGATTNYLAVDPGIASGSAPTLSAKGNDTNVNLALLPKGNACVKVYGSGAELQQNTIIRWLNSGNADIGSIKSNAGTASAATHIEFGQFGTLIQNSAKQTLFQVNNAYATNTMSWLIVDSAPSGGSPKLWVQGADTNIDIALTPKGAGAINIATNAYTGTAGTLNGYLPIKVNGTLFKVPLYNV